jgi:flagellar biosynthesis protein FlhB
MVSNALLSKSIAPSTASSNSLACGGIFPYIIELISILLFFFFVLFVFILGIDIVIDQFSYCENQTKLGLQEI